MQPSSLFVVAGATQAKEQLRWRSLRGPKLLLISGICCWLCFLGAALPEQGKTEKTAAVIFLHGLGDNGDSWRSNFRNYVGKAKWDHVAWAFPTAPKRPVQLNFGSVMTAWYDIERLDPDDKDIGHDLEGIAASVMIVENTIEKLLKRHPRLRPDRIVVGGFSQGAVVSIAALLSSQRRLAGIVATSGYLANHRGLESQLDMAEQAGQLRREVPVLVCHGTKDKLVKIKWGKDGARLMRDSGMNIRWKTFPIGHEVNQEEMDVIISFLAEVLPPGELTQEEL